MSVFLLVKECVDPRTPTTASRFAPGWTCSTARLHHGIQPTHIQTSFFPDAVPAHTLPPVSLGQGLDSARV